MGQSPRQPIDKKVQAKLSERYRATHGLRQLYYWLSDNVQERCPETKIRAQRRYIGFYREHIFAYVDVQRHWIKIGFFSNDIEVVGSKILPFGEFPQWNDRGGGLVGYLLWNEENLLLDVLSACYRLN
jgi:Domain of unknown function (DUF5655)